MNATLCNCPECQIERLTEEVKSLSDGLHQLKNEVMVMRSILKRAATEHPECFADVVLP